MDRQLVYQEYAARCCHHAADAILDVWYSGEEGGNAVADVLFGDVTPAGRLPVTFPRFVGQVPLYYNHKPTGRGTDYTDMSGRPQFPFGFGLSYTSFEYSDIRISPAVITADDTLQVTCRVKNIGDRAGGMKWCSCIYVTPLPA